MKSALLGYTGFVGSNLSGATTFDGLYNSTNIGDLAGSTYDLVVSSANRADSHRINQNGADDRAEIDALIDIIEQATIGKLVLISTVCVYPGDTSPDENSPLSEAGLTPYGANRLHQEQRLADHFDTLIVRLPQLYGDNLKKGVVYDLLNDYRVEYIRPGVSFQHYDVRTLWSDIQRALDLGLPSLNIATPPMTNDELARRVFGRELESPKATGDEAPFSQMYTRDMRTIHDTAFGGADGYLETYQQEIDGLKQFVASNSPDGSEED